MTSETGKVVCVTGASGYLASWLVKLLLQRGYTVKATVRNLSDPSKVSHLKELEGAKERLHLFEASLLEDGSFDYIVDGCDGVFHTASPVILSVTDPQAELIEPAVKGTLNVLKSCGKMTSIRRVVITSSIVSLIYNRNVKRPHVVVDETCKEKKYWYPLAKTLADEAEWRFAEQNGIDLVIMHPGFCIGPLIQPTLNLSSQLVVDLIKGKKIFSTYDFVDARDVNYAHILAFENPSATGKYCLVGTVISHHEAHCILQKLYPVLDFPEDEIMFQVCRKKAEGLGHHFTPLEVSLKYIVESLKDRTFITL